MNKHAAIGKKCAPTTGTIERIPCRLFACLDLPSKRGMIVPELLLLYHRETLRPSKPRLSKTARYRERLSATINPKPAAFARRHSTTILSQSGRHIAGECLRSVSVSQVFVLSFFFAGPRARSAILVSVPNRPANTAAPLAEPPPPPAKLRMRATVTRDASSW